ncbi:hypothetical protein SAM19_03167 [Brevibacillus laterosporus]|nr:hypothetical protein [Brevibacillus laterosporus]
MGVRLFSVMGPAYEQETLQKFKVSVRLFNRSW